MYGAVFVYKYKDKYLEHKINEKQIFHIRVDIENNIT